MASVIDHYEELLAAHYSWMFGDFDATVAQQAAVLRDLGIASGGGALAVDLGCGSGFQSIALAELGYRVIAVDTSQRLLDELQDRASSLAIESICQDLCAVPDETLHTARVVACMGDTLTHLESHAAVAELMRRLGTALSKGAVVILTFRDMTQSLEGLNRFIPVRADNHTIMTCFLEYEADTVRVHDLIYSYGQDGWSLKKSAYRKLRLSGAAVAEMLKEAGFRINTQETEGGMVTLRAEKED